MILEFAILAVSLYVLWAITENYFPSRKYPPGPFRFPILGNTLTILKGRNKPPFILFRDLTRKYGKLTYIQMGTEPTVLVDDFDTAKQLLNSELWIDRPCNDFIMERSYGKPYGIIFVAGDGWREMRRFSMRTLRDFGYGKQANMQSMIEDEVSLLLEKVDKVASSSSTDAILDFKHLFTMPVLNILWGMVSAVRTPDDDAKLKRLVMLVDNLARASPFGGSILDLYPSLRHVAPGLTGMTFIRQCVKELQEYFQDVLDTRRKEGGWKEDGRDFIDMFIKEIDRHEKLGTNPNHYTPEQFITTITDLFEAGSETSSNTLEFAMYYTIKHPRVQKKVQEEIDRVVGRSRLPTIADRAQMPYTEATLIEVQRMANVLPMTVRSTTENTQLDGYFVEKGTVAFVNIYSMHMSHAFWKDPYVFRPERFLDENNQIIMQKANRVIPFGAGKRVCLGEQMARTTLFSYYTALLQSYNFGDIPQEEEQDDNKNINFCMLADAPDPDTILFQKWVHVGFTLSPNPYQAKLAKRS